MPARVWWNALGGLVYVAATVLSVLGLQMFTLVFAMADDDCHDSTCSESYHQGPAIWTMWIGVAVVCGVFSALLAVQIVRNRIAVGWALLGALGYLGVFVLSFWVLHH